MSGFKDREKAFEDKFKHDEELAFRAAARRNKMLGLWLAEQFGLSGDDADNYAKEVIRADLSEPGYEDVVRKVMADIAERGADITEAHLRRELERFDAAAKTEVLGE